jgi:hypothetical protein
VVELVFVAVEAVVVEAAVDDANHEQFRLEI